MCGCELFEISPTKYLLKCFQLNAVLRKKKVMKCVAQLKHLQHKGYIFSMVYPRNIFSRWKLYVSRSDHHTIQIKLLSWERQLNYRVKNT